jgi:hypothetical protein
MKYTFQDPSGQSGYSDKDGVFFLFADEKLVGHAVCRESFEHRIQENIKAKILQIGFKKPDVTRGQLTNFWHPIFTCLDKQSVLFFHTCNIPDTIVINLRAFWLQHQIRRSLLTLLLRASCCYSNFDSAATNYKLLNETLLAFKLFVDGYTLPTFECDHFKHGWNYYFRLKTEAEIKQLLSKP